MEDRTNEKNSQKQTPNIMTVQNSRKRKFENSNANEVEKFYKSLTNFLTPKGIELNSLPQLVGQEIDLFFLYNEVTSRGGFKQVTENNLWTEISQYFNFPPSSTPSVILFGLQSMYNRYLYDYEQAFFFSLKSNSSSKENSEKNKNINISNNIHLSNNNNNNVNTTVTSNSTNINVSHTTTNSNLNSIDQTYISSSSDNPFKPPSQFTALMDNIPQVFHARNLNYIRTPIPIFSKRLRADSNYLFEKKMSLTLESNDVSEYILNEILIHSYRHSIPIQSIFRKLMNVANHLWNQTLELLQDTSLKYLSTFEQIISKLEIISCIFCNFVATETNDSYLSSQSDFIDLVFQWLSVDAFEKQGKLRLFENSIFILLHLSYVLILTERNSIGLKSLIKHLTIYQDPTLINQILEIIANLSLSELNQPVFAYAKNSNLFTQLEDLILLNPETQYTILLIFHNFSLFGSMRTKLQIVQQPIIKKIWIQILQTRPLPAQEAKLISQTLLHLVSEPKTKSYLKPYELLFAELMEKNSNLAQDMSSLLLHLS